MPNGPASMHRRMGLRLFFVLFFILFGILILVFFFVLVILFIEVVGDGVEVDGMRLGNFQFRFTLWAAQNFALLYFVLVHIYFGSTIGAANHGTILRKNIPGAETMENRDRHR